MKRASASVQRFPRLRQLRQYRPSIETLEDRLPPGDALSGALLGGALLEPAGNRAALVSKPAADFREQESWAGSSIGGGNGWGGVHPLPAIAAGNHTGIPGREGKNSQPVQEIHFSRGLENLPAIEDLDPLASLDSFQLAPPRPLRQSPTGAGAAPEATGALGGTSSPGAPARPEGDGQPGPVVQPVPGGFSPINEALWEEIAGLGQGIQPRKLGAGNNGDHPPPPPTPAGPTLHRPPIFFVAR